MPGGRRNRILHSVCSSPEPGVEVAEPKFQIARWAAETHRRFTGDRLAGTIRASLRQILGWTQPHKSHH